MLANNPFKSHQAYSSSHRDICYTSKLWQLHYVSALSSKRKFTSGVIRTAHTAAAHKFSHAFGVSSKESTPIKYRPADGYVRSAYCANLSLMFKTSTYDLRHRTRWSASLPRCTLKAAFQSNTHKSKPEEMSLRYRKRSHTDISRALWLARFFRLSIFLFESRFSR